MFNKSKKNVKTPWEQVQKSREIPRGIGMEYVKHLFEDHVFHRGDRILSEDSALLCGVGMMDGQSVSFIISNKGADLNEQIENNFSMCSPAGFYKAIRTMKQAEKFNRPLITIVNTPGAYPGVKAEEDGQSLAIANSLMQMMNLKIPVICCIVGEGGSGGALAISCGNRVLMLENSIYSVISPEGCSSILWKDKSKAAQAAAVLKLTSSNLLELGVIDEIIPEVEYENSLEFKENILKIKERLLFHIKDLKKLSSVELVRQRANRFKKIGEEAWEL